MAALPFPFPVRHRAARPCCRCILRLRRLANWLPAGGSSCTVTSPCVACSQRKPHKDDGVFGNRRIGADECLQPIDFRFLFASAADRWASAPRAGGRRMAIGDFINRQPSLGQLRMRNAVAQIAEAKFIGPDAKDNRRANFLPTSRAAAQVDAAAVGDQTGLRFRLRGAQNQRVIAKIGMYIAQRRQQRLKELIARRRWAAPSPIRPTRSRLAATTSASEGVSLRRRLGRSTGATSTRSAARHDQKTNERTTKRHDVLPECGLNVTIRPASDQTARDSRPYSAGTARAVDQDCCVPTGVPSRAISVAFIGKIMASRSIEQPQVPIRPDAESDRTRRASWLPARSKAPASAKATIADCVLVISTCGMSAACWS